jgi:putative DeoR family transcriptional regulator (stage III sporulation protein D)
MAGWEQDPIGKELGISQPYVSRLKITAREKMELSPKDTGEWQIEYYDGYLSIKQKSKFRIKFTIDSELWNNLVTWLINESPIPIPAKRPVTRRENVKPTIPISVRYERAIMYGTYIVENNATIRMAAEHFGVSKSSMHLEIKSILTEASPELFNEVQNTIAFNKAQRALRSGEATKQKYIRERERLHLTNRL